MTMKQILYIHHIIYAMRYNRENHEHRGDKITLVKVKILARLNSVSMSIRLVVENELGTLVIYIVDMGFEFY